MHAQDVALRAVQPREDDGGVSRPDAVEPVHDARVEDEPRFGRSLVGLSGGGFHVGQRRLDRPDHPDLVDAPVHGVLLPLSTSHAP
jgi:hypothetical protein